MATPKKIIIKDLELADEEIARLRKENKELKEDLNFYYKAAKQFRKDKDVLMKENEELEKENKELKEKLEEVAKELIQHHEEYKNMADMVVELGKENKELKAQIAEYDDLTEELDYRKREAKRLGRSSKNSG